jgi:hypothetical protein
LSVTKSGRIDALGNSRLLLSECRTCGWLGGSLSSSFGSSLGGGFSICGGFGLGGSGISTGGGRWVGSRRSFGGRCNGSGFGGRRWLGRSGESFFGFAGCRNEGQDGNGEKYG